MTSASSPPLSWSMGEPEAEGRANSLKAKPRLQQLRGKLRSSPNLRICRWIKDPEVTGDRRLADCEHILDPKDIGTAEYFVRYMVQRGIAAISLALGLLLLNLVA